MYSVIGATGIFIQTDCYSQVILIRAQLPYGSKANGSVCNVVDIREREKKIHTYSPRPKQSEGSAGR